MRLNLPNYTLEDFLKDPSFRNWVYNTNAADKQKWDNWLAANAGQEATALRAATLLTGLAFNPTPVPELQVKESWQRLKHRITFQNNQAPVTRVQQYTPSRKYWQNWAAAIALAGICSGLLYYFGYQVREQVYHTNFGETATLILPDSSTVVLNSNTTLHYRANWQPGQPREVWLEGEAFFTVLKKPGRANAHFIVHTPQLNVKVLGTRFNVTNRRQKTTVVLNSGKVSLSAAPEPAKQITASLVPGELAELAPNRQTFRKRRVNPELYSSWTHKKLIFQATPLADIVTLLEENYGFQVQVTDAQLLSRRLTGQIYLDDVNTLLVALSTSFNLKLEKHGQKLLLAPGATPAIPQENEQN